MGNKAKKLNYHQRVFELPETADAAWLSEALAARVDLVAEPAGDDSAIRYLDTYDWRLYRNQLELTCQEPDSRFELSLHDRRTGYLLASVSTRRMPRSLEELPPGRLSNLMASIVTHRTLYTAFQVQSPSFRYRIHDEKSKTIAHLVLYPAGQQGEEIQLRDRQHRRMPALLVAAPHRGYENRFPDLLESLEQSIGLQGRKAGLLGYLVKSTRPSMVKYRTKPNIDLPPRMDSREAVRLALSSLFSKMEANEPGMLQDIDSECLHDFRTSLRRSRSLLKHFRDYIDKRQSEKLNQELGWLGQQTGRARDIDVHLLNYRHYQEMLPDYMRSGLEPLRQYLLEQKRHEHGHLQHLLESPRHGLFRQEWKLYLSEPARTDNPDWSQCIYLVASRKIWHLYKTILEESNVITENSEDSDLHHLRKRFKVLRYLVEIFRSLYPDESIAKIMKPLKQVQEFLGEYQDLAVQLASLKAFLMEMPESTPELNLCQEAIAELAISIQHRQREMRTQFHEILHDLSRPQYRKLFRKTFRTGD